MRPKASHDPAVKPVEEASDMGLAIISAPISKDRIDLDDKLLRSDWSPATGALTNLVFEVSDGFLTWERITPSPVKPALDLRSSQPQRSRGLLDPAAEKLKPVSNVHEPGVTFGDKWHNYFGAIWHERVRHVTRKQRRG